MTDGLTICSPSCSIVFVPLSALYTRVHSFTNPPAFIFVMLVHVLVSVVSVNDAGVTLWMVELPGCTR